MTSSVIDTCFIAPRSRRAVLEAVLDWRHEQSVATTRSGGLVCRLRAFAAIGRALFFSLPGEFRQIPVGDVLIRMAVLLLAAALLYVVRSPHPDWLAAMNRSEPFVRLLMFAQAIALRAAIGWPAAFLWRSRQSLPPLPIAMLAFVTVWVVDSQLLSLGFMFGPNNGPIRVMNARTWMEQFDVLLTSWTVPVLAAAVTFVACVVVNGARGWRLIGLLAAIPSSLYAWTALVVLFQQEATRLVYGRPAMGLIFAPERMLLTNVGFALAVLTLMWFLVARSKGATSAGMTGDRASAAPREPAAQPSSGGFFRSSAPEATR